MPFATKLVFFPFLLEILGTLFIDWKIDGSFYAEI
jgi:hypothetical protein